MKVTVNLGSSRPGGVDITLAGLARQTFTDFEVIFVDDRYHKRHRLVLDAVRRYGIRQPFYHVPNHRYRDDPIGSVSAGYNTGFMLAEGEIVLFLMDYSYPTPNWIEEHVKWQSSGRKITIGTQIDRVLSFDKIRTKDGDPPLDLQDRKTIDCMPFEQALNTIVGQRERYDEISIFYDGFFNEDKLEAFELQEIKDIKLSMQSGVIQPLYFYTKNEAFPLEAVLEINGMDENCDRACLPGDHDLGLRLAKYLKTDHWLVKEALIHCLNPRIFLPKPISVMNPTDWLPPPYNKFLPIHSGGLDYFEKSKAIGNVNAPNPFNIYDRRKEIMHWKKLSQKRDAVIPKNVVSDITYYKKDIKDTYPSWFYLTKKAYTEKNWLKCIEYAEKVLTTESSKSRPVYEIHMYYNVALSNVGRIEDAIKSCEIGLKSIPGEPLMTHNIDLYKKYLESKKSV